MLLKFKKTHKDAQSPIKSSVEAAGFDLFAVEITTTPQYTQINTGIAVEIPIGCVGVLVPRSSITKKDLMLKNSIGIIDSDYRGPIMARFITTPWRNVDDTDVETDLEWETEGYQVGDKCCQLLILPAPYFELQEVEELSGTQRGEGGFGSTGK